MIKVAAGTNRKFSSTAHNLSKPAASRHILSYVSFEVYVSISIIVKDALFMTVDQILGQVGDGITYLQV